MYPYDNGMGGGFNDPMYAQYQQQAAELKKLKDAQAAKPGDLKFNSLLGKNGQLGSQYQLSTASLMDQFKNQLGGVNINEDAYNAMKGRALSTGDSPWLTMQKQLLGTQMAQQRDDSQAQAMSGNANAMSQLAAHGGLDSGAAERLAMGGAKNLNAIKQQNARSGMQQGLNLNIADDQTKQALLGQVAGLDLQNANFDLGKTNTMLNQLSKEQSLNQDNQKFNIGNALTETQNKRNFDMDQYKQKMTAWGTEQTAKAQEDAGKK